MIKISRLADYATLLLRQLMQANGGRLSASDLAEHTGIAYPTVCKVLKQLADSSLVLSQRGVNGGYRLARSAQLINLYEVVSAIDGELALTECCIPGASCVHDASCSLGFNWQAISKLVVQLLSAVTLDEMASQFDLSELLDRVKSRTALKKLG